MKYWLVGTSCKPRKFSQPASQLQLPAKPAGAGNSIKSGRNREADSRGTNQQKVRKEVKEESKKKADDCRSSIEQKHRKVEGSYSIVQKAEESKRKIESKSIEWLRVAESRYEKKVESRSKNQTGEGYTKSRQEN